MRAPQVSFAHGHPRPPLFPALQQRGLKTSGLREVVAVARTGIDAPRGGWPRFGLARPDTLQKLRSRRVQSVRPGSLTRVVCAKPETIAPARLMCSA